MKLPKTLTTLTLATFATLGSNYVQAEQINTDNNEKNISTYTLQKGDTLWDVAEKQCGDGHTYKKIAAYNNIDDPHTIHKGNSISIPCSKEKETIESKIAHGTYQETLSSNFSQNSFSQDEMPNYHIVTKGDTLGNIAQQYYKDNSYYVDIASLNSLDNPNYIKKGDILKLPSTPHISKNYDSTKNHIKKNENNLNISHYTTTITINKGDTPSSVAKKYPITSDKFMEEIDLENPKNLLPGKYQIEIPFNSIGSYKLLDKNYNRKLVLNKSGEEIKEDRFSLGVEGLSMRLGFDSGNCYATGEEKIENIQSKHELITQASENFKNVSPSLLAGLASQESGGNTFCMSETGSIGIVGLTYYLYDKKYHINPFNDEQALQAAANHLSQLISYYDDNTTMALTAYNQGMRTVNKAIENTKGEKDFKSPEFIERVINKLPEEGKKYAKEVMEEKKTIQEQLQIWQAVNN